MRVAISVDFESRENQNFEQFAVEVAGQRTSFTADLPGNTDGVATLGPVERLGSVTLSANTADIGFVHISETGTALPPGDSSSVTPLFIAFECLS